jgi:hypothetical protein
MPEPMPLTESDIRNLSGADEVIRWYGRWPTFHDSYLLEVHFSMLDWSFLKIHLFKAFDGSAGSEAIVTLRLGKLLTSELTGFADQLLDITIFRAGAVFRIDITGALQLNGFIETDFLSFGLCLWPPEENAKFASFI